MALCDATINQGLLKLGAMLAAIPYVPVSPAYSLMSQNFAKLKAVFELIQPGLVYVADPRLFARALAALPPFQLVVDFPNAAEPTVRPFDELIAKAAGPAVDRAFNTIGPDTVAKILLTSGSTGLPKGVLNTHRMMCSNMAATVMVWPFLAKRPPVIVDWLPWSHTFGTNFNFNQILVFGGTMYIDAGKPAPGRIDETIRNLREIAPTLLYNVPRGFDMLLPHVEKDEDLAHHLFSNLDIIFYAGATLPQALWDRLEALAMRVRGVRIPILSALGSTETGPTSTLSHWRSSQTGTVGLPIPGTEIKLIHGGSKLEMRVRGPNVTPGYYRRPDLTAAAFDEDGFFKLWRRGPLHGRGPPGSRIAVRWPSRRRLQAAVRDLGACGSFAPRRDLGGVSRDRQDAVVTGHDQEEVGLLVFPSEAGCRGLCGAAAKDLSLAQLIRQPEVRASLVNGLAGHNAVNPTSSMRIARVLMMDELPSVDGHEITDKGYINQRAVLERRGRLVEALYSPAGNDDVIVLPG